MNKLTIAHRIVLLIAASVIALLLVGYEGLSLGNKSGDSIKHINDNSLASIQILGDARQSFTLTRVAAYAHIFAATDDAKAKAESSLKDQFEAAQKLLKDYEKLISDAEDKKLLEADIANMKAYADTLMTQLIPLSRQNDSEGMRPVITTQLVPIALKTIKGFDDHVAYNRKIAEQTTSGALAAVDHELKLSLATILLALIVVVAIGTMIAREVRFRMNRFREAISHVNESLDFTARLSISRMDELGLSADAFNKLLDRLQGNLKSIASGAHSVASAANAMATTAGQVAAASHQQSEAASNMAATVEEMTVSINHVADRSQEANRLSSESGQLAVSGEKIIGQTTADIQDISARKRSEARLQLAADVFTHVREGIMIADADGVIVEVNDAFTRITGFTRAEAIGRNPRILKSERHTPEFYAAMWKSLAEQGYWSGEIWNRRKNGELYAQGLTISAVRDNLGRAQNYVGLFTDITDMKELQDRLQRIAHYDALTNLPNRVLLADRLQQALAQCHRQNSSVAVVYLDLDDFKAVNDRHGHGVGDALLVAVAQRMKEALREGDTLSRIGGDEFVAVLVNLEHPRNCRSAIERLLLAAAAPMVVDDTHLQVSVSIGVTLYPQDRSDADLLLRHADQALYVAKQLGKNRYHLFDVAQDAEVCTRREGMQHIRAALEQRQFVLHYQPKVNMRSGAVVGAEALLRWQHPERGLLTPAAFLPLIENDALAVELGEWVIASVLTQIELWRTQGLDIPVSVNIGARQLQQDDFAWRLRQMLQGHPSIGPGDLEMEVLESSALDDLLHVSQVIKECREIGVSFALDDFGTGYSSLTYLKRLPVSLLKIDQSFVRDMLDDPDDLAILEGVIGLATAFRRDIVAEGVETVEQGQMLLELGCELAQGYGIGRPMPAADLPHWAANWRPDPAWLNRAPLDRDDLPLLFAAVEHRSWIIALEKYLSNETAAAPPLGADQCRFGVWLATHAMSADFDAVASGHRQVHALAAELCGLKEHGQASAALARIDELHGWRDVVLEQIKALQGQGAARP